MTSLLGLVGAAGAGTTIVFVVLWALEYRRRGRVGLELDRAKASLSECTIRRSELAVAIARYRRELHDMEVMLSACSDPDAIRARIRKLLS